MDLRVTKSGAVTKRRKAGEYSAEQAQGRASVGRSFLALPFPFDGGSGESSNAGRELLLAKYRAGDARALRGVTSVRRADARDVERVILLWSKLRNR